MKRLDADEVAVAAITRDRRVLARKEEDAGAFATASRVACHRYIVVLPLYTDADPARNDHVARDG